MGSGVLPSPQQDCLHICRGLVLTLLITNGVGSRSRADPDFSGILKIVETLEKTWKMLKNVETIGLAALSGWPL